MHPRHTPAFCVRTTALGLKTKLKRPRSWNQEGGAGVRLLGAIAALNTALNEWPSTVWPPLNATIIALDMLDAHAFVNSVQIISINLSFKLFNEFLSFRTIIPLMSFKFGIRWRSPASGTRWRRGCHGIKGLCPISCPPSIRNHRKR